MTNWRIVAAATVTLVAFSGPFEQAAARQGARRAMTGDLTKPIEQYTGNEFFALVRALQFGPAVERPRSCTGNADCTGPANRRTSVRLDQVSDADSLAPARLTQFGVVAARAVNRGNDTEARYGMQAGDRFSYYLIVIPAGGGAATWRLEELDVQGVTRTHRTLASGRIRPCNHSPWRRGARADFRTCEQGIGDAGSSSVFRFASFSGFAQVQEPPIWISCAAGCCTAE